LAKAAYVTDLSRLGKPPERFYSLKQPCPARQSARQGGTLVLHSGARNADGLHSGVTFSATFPVQLDACPALLRRFAKISLQLAVFSGVHLRQCRFLNERMRIGQLFVLSILPVAGDA